eukprot:12917828-Prorocentrum_lima.AAC.1
MEETQDVKAAHGARRLEQEGNLAQSPVQQKPHSDQTCLIKEERTAVALGAEKIQRATSGMRE